MSEIEVDEFTINQAARAGARLSFGEFVKLPVEVREVIAVAFERQALALAVISGRASHSPEAAAAAFSPIDQGRSLTTLRLRAMVDRMIGESS